MTTVAKPLILLVGTGMRDYRQYLLESISPHYRLHLLSPSAPTWEPPYLSGATQVPDLADVDALTVAGKAVEDVAGVLCWDEALILPAAHLAAALGAPRPGVAAVAACRDKHATRSALAAAGVPQPESVLVGSLEEALAAAGGIGYPVVLKPRALAASLGVVRADGPADVERHFAFARDTTVPGAPSYEVSVLVEQYADGPEISVDSVVHDGVLTPVVLARKEVGYEPYFEELGHIVDGADPLLADEGLRAVLQHAHDAIGLRDGFTHTELRLTADAPLVIEINARLGGGLIPHLGTLATGVDPGPAAAAAACGLPPEVARDRSRVAGIRFFYADAEDTTVASIAFDAEALPPAIAEAVTLVKPGAVVSPPPRGTTFGRLAFAIAVAQTAAECRAALDGAGAALRVTT
ncbi:ATP-grasp domain-containing protein [Dactylosporangium sp. NPDC051485]|uniref:ATP-grasp domain-containing protein n=1 Tax=Dactylosporangium sp. NPDC051485 TaxID=3154846 RepID=UPI00341CD1FD